jgi:adenosylcobyric acid synthase
MAEMADAVCLLVGDIDRGGVFASLLGTVELLDPPERDRIGGFCINKFRGDRSLLLPGVRMMEERLRKPCLGIVDYLPALALEEEDSVGLPAVARTGWPADGTPSRVLRVAVVAFPLFANFTDFDSLRAEPAVDLRFCRSAEGMAHADVVILPGSKQTMSDLAWMRQNGLDAAVHLHAGAGLVVGICGGMQMLGCELFDPVGIEGQEAATGLGLLPIHTTMRAEKVTRLSAGSLSIGSLFGQPLADTHVCGYEIHVGETTYLEHAEPFALLTTGERDGCIAERVLGTYLHGVFDEDSFRHQFVTVARTLQRLTPAAALHPWKAQRAESLDRLAQAVSESLDMQQIFAWVGLTYHE